jgi:hypothetical protein
MSLRRIDTAFDLLEAHIIAGMLEAEGIAAYVFDTGFVRQDWFKAIAYGGYRIMVADEDVPAAIARIQRYRDDTTPLSDASDPPCPKCASHAYRDDPRPRCRLFLVWILLQAVTLLFLVRSNQAHPEMLIVVSLPIAIYVTLIVMLLLYVRHRFVCDACGHRWRDANRRSYTVLARANAGAFGPPS